MLTAGDHEIEVNGVTLRATWDGTALGSSAECTGGCFALSGAEPVYEYALDARAIQHHVHTGGFDVPAGS